MTITTLYI